MRTADLQELLRKRVLGPEGQGAKAVLLDEVPAKTGFADHRLDFVSVGMWPSRGCLFEGYETKVSRSDWLGELKEPEKAEEIARYMDRFWLVIGDDSVIRDGEVPPLWGILRAEKRSLVCDREASPLSPDGRPPEFVAALLRRAVKADFKRELRTAKKEAKETAEFRVKSEVIAFERRVADLEDSLEAYESDWARFEEISGTSFPAFLRNQQERIERVAQVSVALLSVAARVDPVGEIDRALGRIDAARVALASARQELEPDESKEVVPHG